MKHHIKGANIHLCICSGKQPRCGTRWHTERHFSQSNQLIRTFSGDFILHGYSFSIYLTLITAAQSCPF